MGVEITVSKGYLIHQFLSGHQSPDRRLWRIVRKRFRFAARIALAVRAAVGENFLSDTDFARDYNWLPLPHCAVAVSMARKRLERDCSNRPVAQERENGGIDYLHISNGFGFHQP